jgi:molybdenum cofactor cytidylyltransferase
LVAAIVLAAGGSRRFGSQKLIAPLAGKPLVRWAVEHALASRVAKVIVVLGYEASSVRAVLDGLPVRFTTNERWAEGMSGSIRAGITALSHDTSSALVLLGDQPGITPCIIDRLIAAHTASALPIVAPSYHGVRGNPVVFSVAIFPELLTIRGDQGAREVIIRDPGRVELVEMGREMPGDVDSVRDLGGTSGENCSRESPVASRQQRL